MLPFIALVSVLTVIFGVLGTYAFLWLVWPPAMRLASSIAALARPSIGTVGDTFVGIHQIVPAPIVPQVDVHTALWVACISAVLLIINVALPGRYTPLRSWISANFILLVLGALYGFFVQKMAYDGATFMILVARTSMIMMLVAPMFTALMMLLLPFSLLERILMVVFCVLLDGIFSVVRVVAFALFVARFGVLYEANLYMFLGPLVDVVFFMTIYSACTVALAHRLARSPEAWRWL
jgi:hypothetical protein